VRAYPVVGLGCLEGSFEKSRTEQESLNWQDTVREGVTAQHRADRTRSETSCAGPRLERRRKDVRGDSLGELTADRNQQKVISRLST
jgi:hypothetical protein